MATTLDFEKLPADQHVTAWIAPTSDVTGISNVAVPTAPEINNTGGASGVIPASQTISWNDYDFGISESETSAEPSLADISTYESFGMANYGGNVSCFAPRKYDDNSNLHSVIYDITDEPGALVDIITRIDGDTRTSEPAADGDFVSVYRAQANGEANPFNMGESVRRTVNFTSAGDFAHYTIVGAHTITAVAPSSFAEGDKGRIRGIVQDRDYTNALRFSTSDGDVIDVHPGGFYEVTGTGTATVTIEDEEAGTSTTVEVTVA